MDIRQLRYFRVIATEGTISGAAKQLYMTQPSLSQQLRILEQGLGVKLLDRGSRKIKLTEAGRLLYERAGQMLEILNTTEAEVKELHEGYKGTLSIGTIASAGTTLLPGVIRSFHQKYPNVKFQLYEGDTSRILDLLNNGLIEIGLIRSAFNSEFYHWLDLAPEPFIIAIAKTWDHGSHCEFVPLTELADMPLLVHRSNENMIVDCCRKAGFEPHILCKGDDVRSLLVLANEGIGAAVVAKSALGLVPSSGLTYRILDAPLEIKKAVIWMRDRYLSTTAKNFINAIEASSLSIVR